MASSSADPSVFSPIGHQLDLHKRGIFQTWKTTHQLPDNFKVWSESWQRLNPGLGHVLWDDADNRAFVSTFFPELTARYDSFDREIFRADYIRYLYLFWYGGIYADMDFECLKPFNKYFSASPSSPSIQTDIVLGRMGEGAAWHEHRITNALMLAQCRRHIFWVVVVAMIEEVMQTYHGGPLDPAFATGPVRLFKALELLHKAPTLEALSAHPLVEKMLRIMGSHEPVVYGGVQTVPPSHWCPIDWTTEEGQAIRKRVVFNGHLFTEEEKKAHFPDAMAVTYFTCTWGPW